MTGYIIGLAGLWMLQDGMASICYYPSEKWRWNHMARLIRIVWGITLIYLGASLI